MAIDYTVIIAYVVGILLLCIMGRLLLVPLKLVLQFVYSALIGGIALIIINYVGSMFEFHIALNLVTALITGILGIPGVVLLITLKYLFGV